MKIAYFKLAKLYHPDTLPPNAPPELERLKAEIFGYIGDAYRMLSDDKSRADYIERSRAARRARKRWTWWPSSRRRSASRRAPSS